MGQCPSSSHAVGHRQPGVKAALGQRSSQLIGQRPLAAKSLAHPANVQQQAFRPVSFFQPHAGTELVTRLGQLHQCQAIG